MLFRSGGVFGEVRGGASCGANRGVGEERVEVVAVAASRGANGRANAGFSFRRSADITTKLVMLSFLVPYHSEHGLKVYGCKAIGNKRAGVREQPATAMNVLGERTHRKTG